MKPLLIVVLAMSALFGGCATAQTPAVTPSATAQASQTLASITAADLDAAIATAQANNDPAGAACFTALKANVGNAAAEPKVAGLASAYEAARVHVRGFQAGLPEAVTNACAPLIVDAQTALIKLGLLFAGAPGAAAAGLPIVGAVNAAMPVPLPLK